MKFLNILLSILPLLLIWSCEKDILFDTVEAPSPQVTDVGWTANGVAFAEGGRVFRLPNPTEEGNIYRDIEFQVQINSNDQRQVDSIAVELQWIPSLPSNAPQGWQPFEGIKIPEGEQSSSFDFTYNLNLDDWNAQYTQIYCGPGGCDPPIIGVGLLQQFGLVATREDNTLRLKVFFDDGSMVRLAQVQFSYPLTPAGIE
jgi:hypothetical protein